MNFVPTLHGYLSKAPRSSCPTLQHQGSRQALLTGVRALYASPFISLQEARLRKACLEAAYDNEHSTLASLIKEAESKGIKNPVRETRTSHTCTCEVFQPFGGLVRGKCCACALLKGVCARGKGPFYFDMSHSLVPHCERCSSLRSVCVCVCVCHRLSCQTHMATHC